MLWRADDVVGGTALNDLSLVQAGHLGRHVGGATCSHLITSLRAVAERFRALLDQRWNALRPVSLGPATAGTIAAAALTLIHLERQLSRFLVRKR